MCHLKGIFIILVLLKLYNMKQILLLKLFTILSVFIFAQQTHDFGFKNNNNISVKDSLGNELDMPWAGGLNAVHFQQMDLNLDGKMDLISFDLHGDVLKTFINYGDSNEINYKYEPQYEPLLPPIENWIKTRDFNNDGKLDLFTYAIGGIKVYKNISTQAKGLKFQLENAMLMADYGSGVQINLHVSSVDYPGIVDIDHDGDLDVLNFGVLGSYVYYFKNYSMELYGEPDHWEFKLYDKCWGNFAESENSNSLYLNQDCSGSKVYTNYDIDEKGQKHTGSTVLMLDLNADSLYDMILGDVDYFTIAALINGGTVDTAHIIAQDTTFPEYSQPINITDFPLVTYFDIDNDNIKEMIVGSFDAVHYKPQGYNSVHLYENSNTNDSPYFHLVKKDLFQEDMIDAGDAATPAIVDVDGDGLMDLVIGNYGKVDSTYYDTVWYILYTSKHSHLTYYKNVGTASQPEFQLMTKNWQDIYNLGLTATKPTFGDLDGDGDMDMILGSQDGDLVYFENIAGAGNPIAFAPPVLNYKNISVGEFSTPQLFDINGDSLLDLVIGKKNGYLSYYKNTGTATTPNFTKITDSMGNVSVATYYHSYSSYSNPHFYKDKYDSLKLFVGSASGLTFFFKNIRGNETDTFDIDSNIVYIHKSQGYILDTLYSVLQYENYGYVQQFSRTGLRSAPALYDFDGDGKKDMILGTFQGGLKYYQGVDWPFVAVENIENKKIESNIYPNPTKGEFNISIQNHYDVKRLQIQIFDISGKLVFNKSTSAEAVVKIQNLNFKNGVYIVNTIFENKYGDIQTKTSKLIVN
jgi:hypothetical protein